MAKINSNYDKLAAGYLFPEIARRTNSFLDANPGIEVMRLGIGDTTEPIAPAVLEGLRLGVDKLGKVETYSGYGASEGIDRCQISYRFSSSGKGNSSVQCILLRKASSIFLLKLVVNIAIPL